MIRSEWIKFRSVPGWLGAVTGVIAAVVALGGLAAAGVHQSCMNGTVEVHCPPPPTGPGGEAVDDRFSFVHRPLTGDGELTAKVGGLRGIITYPPPDHDEIVPGLVPWTKAGIMVKAGLTPGDAYAAVLLTARHGVRMQSDFTRDTAAPGFPAVVWLRVRRTGEVITGYASADGTAWHEIGTARLAGLPATAQIGLFVASPGDVTAEASPLGGSIVASRFTQATADFSQVTPAGGWTFDKIGRDGPGTDWEKTHPSGVIESAGVLTITGSGDIAPSGHEAGMAPENILTGLNLALFVVIVVAVSFVTAEYRTGLMRTTLAASPVRGRVLAAKAVVIALVTFVAGLIAAGLTLPLADHILRSNAVALIPVPPWTSARVVLGTAALLSLAALFAYGIGTVLRRGLAAVVLAAVLLILPYLLATTSILPDSAADWLMRVTPAAGFAIRQTVIAYPQVVHPYTPADGYYPLAPLAGLGVFALYTATALGLGWWRLRRADA